MIGIINNHSKKLKIEISTERDSSTLKKIIRTYINTGNIP